jgi:hypothetical protein
MQNKGFSLQRRRDSHDHLIFAKPLHLPLPPNPMKKHSMTTMKLKFVTAGLLASTSILYAQTTRTWDAGGGTDLNWATAANWSSDTVPGAAEFALFGTAGAITDVSGTTNVVDSNRNIARLAYDHTGSGLYQITRIESGATLTAGTGPTSAPFLIQFFSGTNISNVIMNGGGSLSLNGRFIAGRASNADSANIQTVTLDMSGLSAFTTNGTEFQVAFAEGNNHNSTQNSTVRLASGTNTITVGNFRLGVSLISGGQLDSKGSVSLGATNTINADTINVGAGRFAGELKFDTGIVNTGTVTIRNQAGTGNANLLIANQNVFANIIGGTVGSSVDFGQNTVDAQFGSHDHRHSECGEFDVSTGRGRDWDLQLWRRQRHGR